MTDGWRERLNSAVEASGKSARAISIEANCAHGYVYGLINEGKSPTVEKLDAICTAVGIPLYWVMYGHTSIAQAQELIALWEAAPATTRGAILALLREQRRE